MKKTLFLALLIGLLSGCRKESIPEGDYFFLRSNGADMPVWFRGNRNAKTMLLVLHGGPGDKASGYIGLPSFSALEREYGVVYWDQRSSGNAQGNAQPASLTPGEFANDLDKLVELVRSKYNDPTLFLLGHSWGGALGTEYLLSPARHQKVRGWIIIDGLFHTARSYELSKKFVTDYAQQQLNAGNDRAKWQKIMRFYENHPVPDDRLLKENTDYVGEANGYYYKGKELTGSVGLFNSPRSGSSEYFNNENVERYMLQDILKLNYTPYLSRITLPTLVLWGAHDGILPAPTAQEYYQTLGTISQQKSVVLFNESAHNPMAEEPSKFADEVIRFVNRYK